MKHISSADNPQFKALLKLVQSARERRLAGYSLLDGAHLLDAYQRQVGVPEQLVLSPAGLENAEIQALIERAPHTPQVLLSNGLFKQLSSVATPTGVITVVKTPRREGPPAKLDTCVMLEDIQDPGNLGSILRSAAGAGIRHICLSKTSVHSWSPRVLRAGMGAHFMLDIHEQCDLVAIAQGFSGRVIATVKDSAASIYEMDLTGNIALIFGNEGQGITPELQAQAHDRASIPMPGAMESLNVGVAAGICLFEARRRRLTLK